MSSVFGGLEHTFAQVVGWDDVVLFGILLVTVAFGAIWTLVNFYNYFPLVQSRVDAVWTRLRPSDTPDDEGWLFVEDARNWWFLANGPYTYRWPDIDILIPAFKEGEVIEQSIRSILETSYPDARLHVHVLLEPGDEDTRRVVRELTDRYDITTLTVPSGYPGDPNKPRALNYGFEQTDGDIVGVIDAEDIVSSGIFREAALAILRGADFTLGHLDMVNENDGWLNLMFRAEYGYWYGQVIPAFSAVDYPIPLGGTSCFFRRPVLEELSEKRYDRYGNPWSLDERFRLFAHGSDGAIPWDPRNLTEDFELGLFHWLEGYEFEFLDSVTQEESPIGLDGWLRQRTRWKTGKLYTFRHFLKHPPDTWRQRFHIYWQSMLPHLGPINIAGLVFVFWLANVAGSTPTVVVRAILGLGLTFVVIVTALYVRGYWLVSDEPLTTRFRRAVIVALSLLFYWALQWLADIRALSRMYRRRFDWEKTVHTGRNEAGVDADPLENRRTGRSLVSSVVVEKVDETTDYVTTASVDIRRNLDPRTTLLLIGGVVLLGIGLRTFALTRWSLWIDEVYTITFRSAIPIRELLVVSYDPHPPLYFLSMHVWLGLFGQGHGVAALFSVLFSGGTLVLMFAFTRLLYDDVTAVVSSLLLAVSTMHIHFGRNIRMYSFLTFFVLLSWYGYRKMRMDSRFAQVGYVCATLAMLYIHVFSIFIVLAQQIHSWVVISDRGWARRWRRVSLVVAIGYLPWAAVLGQQVLGLVTGTGGTAVGWIPAPSPALLRDTILMYAGFPSYYPILAGTDLSWGVTMLVLFAFAVTVPFATVTYYRGEDDVRFVFTNAREATLLGFFFLVPIVVPYIVSHLVVPIYFPRYTIAASLPLFILVARGITNIPERHWRVGILAVLLIGAGVTGATYYTGETVEDWRGTAGVLEQEATPEDELLIIQPFWTQNDVEYYYEGPQMETVGLPGSGFVTQADRAQLRQWADETDRIWIVRYQTDPDDGVIGTLNRTHSLTYSHQNGLLALYRFERGASPTDEVEVVDGTGSIPGACDQQLLGRCVPVPDSDRTYVSNAEWNRTANTSVGSPASGGDQ